MLKNLLLVGVGGFAGSLLRYLASMIMAPTASISAIPLGTLTINIVGSLAIGVLLTATKSESWYHLGVVGICGGFTTFSTFSVEALRLIRSQMWPEATLYIALSVVACILATLLGSYLGMKLSAQ